MRYPVNTPWLHSGYGNRYRNGKMEFHTGWDLYSISGDTRVYPVISGIVIGVSTSSNAGYIITIQHDGIELFRHSMYAHIVKPLVRVGQLVNEDTIIGIYGKIGNATGAHVHFELRKAGDGDTHIDPARFFNGNIGTVNFPATVSSNETNYKGGFFSVPYIIAAHDQTMKKRFMIVPQGQAQNVYVPDLGLPDTKFFCAQDERVLLRYSFNIAQGITVAMYVLIKGIKPLEKWINVSGSWSSCPNTLFGSFSHGGITGGTDIRPGTVLGNYYKPLEIEVALPGLYPHLQGKGEIDEFLKMIKEKPVEKKNEHLPNEVYITESRDVFSQIGKVVSWINKNSEWLVPTAIGLFAYRTLFK